MRAFRRHLQDRVTEMLRMVFEIVMALALVLALVMIAKVGALENKNIGTDDNDSGDNST
ncbi:hypothetical protein [Methylomicrobium lacus]|uniref:hypothetical protein n=1 Tax=Methylomicrobium lacus TaxID=136992 RepID=UPI0035A9579B